MEEALSSLVLSWGLLSDRLLVAEQNAQVRLELTTVQQIVAFCSGGVIKPCYMLLTLVLIIWLSRRQNSDRGLTLLLHGLIWFFAGEAFCAVNFYFHSPGFFYPFNLLHGLGMVAMSALIPLGLFRLLDEKVLHYGDPEGPCLVQRFCRHCAKREAVRCGLHDLMLFAPPALAIVAFMPWTADLHPVFFTTQVFGSALEYGDPLGNQLIELRAYPLLGVAGCVATLVLLLWGGPKSVRRVEPLLFVSFGLVSYPLLRYLLVNAYLDQPYWSDFWEETTELLMILGLGLLLFVFRRQLGLNSTAKPLAPSGPATQ